VGAEVKENTVLKIGFICPVYNATVFASYTQKALKSFFDTTPNGVAIVVNDGSAGWSDDYEQSLLKLADSYPIISLYILKFHTAGGLTRSWNAGLAKATELNLDYAIAGNNDIIFSKGWHEGMTQALANGYSLVGPISNAPGVTAKGKQNVELYIPNYQLTDNLTDINKVATQLQQMQFNKTLESKVNGFFIMATLKSWENGKFDEHHFFKPKNKYSSKGKFNPTPLMTLNEDELQERWAKKGMKSGIALSTFIFHYRSVSRGDKHKKGKWYRQP